MAFLEQGGDGGLEVVPDSDGRAARAPPWAGGRQGGGAFEKLLGAVHVAYSGTLIARTPFGRASRMTFVTSFQAPSMTWSRLVKVSLNWRLPSSVV